MPTIQRTDWKTEPMAAQRRRLTCTEQYTDDEFTHLAAGLLPESMEDKWFIFYEAPWLYLHRSWTGFCIFQVRFEPAERGMRMVDVWVNDDRSHYAETDDTRALGQLLILLGARVGRDVRQQMVDFIRTLPTSD